MHNDDVGAFAGSDATPWILAWRKAERERLIAARMELSADQRARYAGAIATRLDQILDEVAGRNVSLYWPFRGEPDFRPFLQEVTARGGRTALPVVVENGRPLEFHLWQTGEALSRGIWNIPIPAAPNPCRPDIVIAPVVGFDVDCYRLGYGGGFFDRTLAALDPYLQPLSPVRRWAGDA